MNKILTLLFLIASLVIVYAYFIYNDAYNGLSLAIVMAALSSMIFIFMQDFGQGPKIPFSW